MQLFKQTILSWILDWHYTASIFQKALWDRIIHEKEKLIDYETILSLFYDTK